MQRGISQSGISIFRDCPYAFKLHYVDQREPVFYNFDVLDIGGYVHEAIERYYKNYYLTNGTKDDILNKTYSCLKDIWDTTLLPEYLKKAYDCLENHAKWEENNIKTGIGTKPLTEIAIDSGDYYGLIDYIDLPSNRVIDWKTNKFPVLSYEYRMQAYVYKKLFESKFNEKLSHFYFFFLYPNDWRTVSYEKEKQIEVGKDVEKFLAEIKECYDKEEFEKRPRIRSTCKNCNYRLYCKFEGGKDE